MSLLILVQITAQFQVLNTVAPELIIIYKIWSAYDRLTSLKRHLCKNNSEAKPLIIATVDGGPDENLIYTKTIKCAIDYFLIQDLDAFFWATNALGRSAFNRVERRMVKFSKELSGVVLLHDNFGSHLNAKGEATGKEPAKEISGMLRRYWLKSGPVW